MSLVTKPYGGGPKEGATQVSPKVGGSSVG